MFSNDLAAIESRRLNYSGMILLIMDGVRTIIKFLYDLATFIRLMPRPHGALVAEILFLRKQLATYQQRKLKPRRPDTPFRLALVLPSRLFVWKDALVVVQPQTLVRRHPPLSG